jgi:hypothetical protein
MEAAKKEHPADRQILLVSESRMPYPEVPPTVEIMPAWKWMLIESLKGN